MLEKMGELSAGEGKDGGPVRMVPLSPRATEAALLKLQGDLALAARQSDPRGDAFAEHSQRSPERGIRDHRRRAAGRRPASNRTQWSIPPWICLEQIQNSTEQAPPVPSREYPSRSIRRGGDTRAPIREGAPAMAPAKPQPPQPPTSQKSGSVGSNKSAGEDRGSGTLGPRIVFAAQAFAAEPAGKPKPEPAKPEPAKPAAAPAAVKAAPGCAAAADDAAGDQVQCPAP